MKPWLIGVAVLCLTGAPCAHGADPLTRARVESALHRAVEFYTTQVAIHGGYVYAYSGDLKLREGEGRTTESMVWVQPPGTPAVGLAYLDIYRATGDAYYLRAARGTAEALLDGQLRSGGWDHQIEFDPQARAGFGYRDQPAVRRPQQSTSLDDDISQSAMIFLARLDKALNFGDPRLHEASLYALEALLGAQYPNGGWYQHWEVFPRPASEADYPVLKASYPAAWTRQWLNDWTGRYFLNDNVMGNTIKTLLNAYDVYGEDRFLQAAKKAGNFLLLAQMPPPQPAWAQQYDVKMNPVWDRKFEPPAISGRESQDVIRNLMLLYRRSGERRYLEPIPAAVAWLKSVELPDGRLARFYELQTSKPLYFTKDYTLTYSDADMPTHYGFIVDSELSDIQAEYERLRTSDPATLKKPPKTAAARRRPELSAEAARVVEALDARGAWVERATLRYHKIEPASGVISSATFIRNVRTLCDWLERE